ncbi:MAG: hypothetical protein NG737_00450 [Omnitrophica bacterium]|nr:hypothetical protein [Candidatus Omnitrophota bacterium]
MKSGRRALVTFVIFFVFLFEVTAVGRDLVLTLLFDKSQYKKSDQIYVEFKLKNNGEEAVYVNNRFYLNSKVSKKDDREIYLSVISPKGIGLPSKISQETGLPKTDDFILLKSGEETVSQRKRGIKPYFDFLELGVYKITGIYQNVYGREIGLNVYKGRITSEPVTIEIVE